MDGEGNGSRLGVLSMVDEGGGAAGELDASGAGSLGLVGEGWGEKLGTGVDGRDRGDSGLDGSPDDGL
jgi:hypothetical protein